MSEITISEREIYNFKIKLLDFLSKYGQNYPPKVAASILKNFLSNDYSTEGTACSLSQMYQMVGVYDLLPDNSYSRFLKELKARFDINKKLLEVGCGYYPAFAEKLAKEQTRGSIDAIDPCVVTENVKGVNVKKECFTQNYDISKYDLIYGIRPCEATFEMIISANRANKDLFLQACGCGKVVSSRVAIKCSMDMWLKFVESLLKQTTPKNREYKIEYTSSSETPFIYTRKK